MLFNCFINATSHFATVESPESETQRGGLGGRNYNEEVCVGVLEKQFGGERNYCPTSIRYPGDECRWVIRLKRYFIQVFQLT